MTYKPFVKWAGGKTKLLERLKNKIPEEFNNYYEPFLGGGALLINLLSEGKLRGKKVYANDINKNLIITYIVVRDNISELITELNTPQKYENIQETYYNIRTRYNIIKDDDSFSTIEKAALFIYLNKTCYNGMYRENKSGGFNVPYGTMKITNVCDEHLLLALSELFNQHDITFTSKDYKEVVKDACIEDFVYIDSPYDGTFSLYHRSVFDSESHKELFNVFSNIKAHTVLSNSNTYLINELYKDYHKDLVSCKYTINSSVEGRQKVYKEVIITNF